MAIPTSDTRTDERDAAHAGGATGCSLRGACARLRTLHGDEQGTISIVTVFSVMLLAMLLGMVMNVGYQVDGKVKMQNAADAAASSGGIVLARNMNTLVFTNHLLCDIFAVTAFLREASQHNAEQLVPEILAAWTKIGPILAGSGFQKFTALGPAITQKVPLEQQMVTAYGNWAAASAQIILPTWEQILQQQLIPRFQRALVAATPRLAQAATTEIARRHGLGSPERGPLVAVLWRNMGMPVLSEAEQMRRTLPVVDAEIDPEASQGYQQTATQQRHDLSHGYLNDWNNASLLAFDRIGKMSQFANLWRGFTCGQLDKLLNQEYPTSNLPMVIRTPDTSGGTNNYLDQDFKFVAVAYWPQRRDFLPGLFHNVNAADAMTFSQVMLYIPKQKLIRIWFGGGGGGQSAPPEGLPIGGVPGEGVSLPPPPVNAPPAAPNAPQAPGVPMWTVGRESRPTEWDLLNQSWTIKLVPAVGPGMLTILTTAPPVQVTDQGTARAVKVPTLSGMSPQQMRSLTNH